MASSCPSSSSQEPISSCGAANRAIQNLPEKGNFSVSVAAGDAIGWDDATGGFDFSGCTKAGNAIAFPADSLAPIWADPEQKFVLWFYVVFPSLVDMQAGNGSGWFTTATGGAYTTTPDLMTIRTLYTGGNVYISFARQRNGAGDFHNGNVIPKANCYGRICQVSYSRTATAARMKVWSIQDLIDGNAPNISAGAPDVPNTGDFSAKVPRIGIPAGINSAVLTANQQAGTNYKLLGCYLEALAVSGRDPDAVLAEDFARQVQRYGWT